MVSIFMDIIKRNEYYYLGNSFRKKGKITYREKYIGKQIPKNIDEIKEAFLRKCLAEDAFKKLDLIKKNFRKEWKHYPESIKKKILIDLSINMTYNTNAIEGSKITKEETEDIIKRKISPNKPIDDVKETINNSKIFFKIIQERKELNLKMILEWHNAIFCDTKQDISGRLREYSVKVGEYRAPDWQDLKKLMKDYFEWYEKNKNILHPIELAARMHHKFEKIHPFGDGNGRIGRLITTFILIKSKCPLLVIEYNKRKSYYHALEKDENYFLQYFIRRYLGAFKNLIN